MYALPNGICGINLAVEITLGTILSMCNANKISYEHEHNNIYLEVFGGINL
jgi:hypothetical protein